MISRITTAALTAGLLALVLAGCAGPAAETDAPPAASTSASADAGSGTGTGDGYGYGGGSGGSDAPAASAALMVADSALGEIVVDGRGMTVYMFDSDTQGAGTSTCEGQCAANWPAVTTDVADPQVDGVTGEVGTITGVDGAMQVTLNGWPLYYFAGDAAAGDVNGQGVNGVWWVLTPDGERMAQ
jgi:predicted lipoprotein with Yx(FWY)xxD motif